MNNITQIVIDTLGSIQAGKVVQIINELAEAASSTSLQLFHGIAINTTTSGQSNIVQTSGVISQNIINLGDGYACAVGVNSSGTPVRVTDGSCVSGLNYLGYCDGYWTITISPRRTENINVKDFGANGDGLTDDGYIIQKVINYAETFKAPVFFPAATYLINEELFIDTSGVKLIGVPNDFLGTSGTILKAGTTNQRSILAIQTSDNIHIYGIDFNGNAKSIYTVYFEGSSLGAFEKCTFRGATKDGVYLSPINDLSGSAVNDSNIFVDCNVAYNGTVYATTGLVSTYSGNYGSTFINLGSVTASCSTGNQVITFTGTTLTTLGLRNGDYLRLDSSSPEFLQIASIDSNTQISVGLRRTPSSNKTNVDFAISSGNGYHEYPHNDNNLNKWYAGLCRGNAGTALAFCGLYGPDVRLPQIDTNGFYGIALGRFSDNVVIYSSSIFAYYESNLAANILFGGAQGVLSNGLGADNFHVYAGGSWGTTFSGQPSVSDKPIGGQFSDVPVTTGYVNGFTAVGPYLDAAFNLTITSNSATISPSSSYAQAHLDVNHTLTSTPTIAAGTDGQELVIVNLNTPILTLQDHTVLSGSGLFLSTPTVSLAIYDNIKLKYVSGIGWIETGRKLSAIGGNNVASQSLGSSQDGYALTWDNTDGYWKAEPPNSVPSSITTINTSNTRTETSNYTIDSSGPDFIVYVDTSGGPVSITLPAPTNGRIITLKDKKNTFDGYNLTILQHASELIDGYAGPLVVFQKGAEIVINSDGTDYYTNFSTIGQWWQNSAISYWSGWTNGSALVGNVGFIPSTGNTSGGNVTPDSSSLLNSTRRLVFNGSTTGAQLGLRDNTLLSVWRGNAADRGGFRMAFRVGCEQFATSTTTMTLDCLVGLVSNTSPTVTTNWTSQTTYHTIGFGFHGVFASGVSGNWKFITSDGSSSPHVIDCGASFAINTTSLLEMECWAPPNSSVVYFKITDLSTGAIFSGSNGSILPSNTQFMAPYCAIGVTSSATITGTNKFSCARYMIETPN